VTTRYLPTTTKEAIPNLWREVGAWAVLASELCWFSAWYLTIYAHRAPVLVSLVFLAAAIMGSYALVRLLMRSKLNANMRQAVLILWLGIVLVASLRLSLFAGVRVTFGQLLSLPFQTLFSPEVFKSEFWHLLIIILMVWRGSSLATMAIDLTDVHRSFRFGMVMLAIFLAINHQQPITVVLLPVLLFILFGVIALISGRLTEFTYSRGARLPPFNVRWLQAYILIAAVLAVAAVTLGFLLITPAKFVVSQALFLVLLILIICAVVVAAPVLLLLWLLTPWLTQIYEQGWVEMSKIQIPQTELEFTQEELSQVVESAPNWLMTTLIIAGILVVLGIIIAIVLLVRKRQIEAGILVEDDSSQLPSIWPRWLRPQRRRQSSLSQPERLFAAVRIRRMYAELMIIAAKLGNPRPPAQTPLEFLPALVKTFPEDSAGLSDLTSAYIKVRYGSLPESQEEMDRLESQWKAIKSHAEAMQRELRKTKNGTR